VFQLACALGVMAGGIFLAKATWSVDKELSVSVLAVALGGAWAGGARGARLQYTLLALQPRWWWRAVRSR